MQRVLKLFFPLLLLAHPAQAARDTEACNRLLEQLLNGGGGAGGIDGTLDAVMEYFVAGIYLNARLIERQDPTAVPAELLARAREDLPDAKMREMTLALDEAISGARALGETTVFRGQAPNVPKPANGQMYVVGEELRFPQFLSTTPSESLARDYAKGVYLRIRVPAGKRALNVQEAMGSPSESYELLFPRDSRLRVTAVEIRGNQTHIDAEMLD